MKKFKVIKLGTKCRDNALKLNGTITHWIMDCDHHVSHLFQPLGLDDEGRPLKKYYVSIARLNLENTDFEEVEVPIEVLCTDVTNKTSGFKGMAISLVQHTSGCLHVTLQPAGVSEKTRQPVDVAEFDLRECEGEKIQVLTPTEKKESQKEKPSPDGDSHQRQLPTSAQ